MQRQECSQNEKANIPNWPHTLQFFASHKVLIEIAKGERFLLPILLVFYFQILFGDIASFFNFLVLILSNKTFRAKFLRFVPLPKHLSKFKKPPSAFELLAISVSRPNTLVRSSPVR